jgi:hypothetical protein
MQKLLLALVLVFLVPAFVTAEPVTVQTGDLAKRNFAPNGLYAIWTGLSGYVPVGTQRVDFRAQLQKAWNLKCQRKACTPSAKKARDEILKRYPIRPTTMTLSQYVKHVDAEVTRAYADMDWPLLYSVYGLSSEQGAVLKNLMFEVRARELIAYSLTELMPDPYDGGLNVSALEFLLRYAGREYLELLPAVNDKYTSFGNYQFTFYAIFDDGNETRGASTASQALKRRGIPGSVIKLKGPQHHRAAWLFAIDNLQKVVRRTSKKDVKTLNALAHRPGELVKVIACAHHAPAPCARAAVEWVKKGAKGEFQFYRQATYIKKTKTNYAALG